MHVHSLAAALGCSLLLTSALAVAADRPDLEVLRFEFDKTRAQVLAQARRASYPEYFRRAYARYPNLPAGSLEAIAYAETGWNHVAPEAQNPRDLHMPRSYGVMGLYHGGGFADQVGEGARLIGRNARQVIDDPQSNILAGAALLDRALAASRGDGRSRALAQAEDLAPVLARYAGYGASNGGIADYARQSFAYAVLQALERGVSAQGVEIPAQPLRLERAFDAEQLQKLRAPALLIDAGADRVRVDRALVDQLAGPPARPTVDAGAKAVDFGEAIWNPASPSNYSTASNAMSAVILHTMEGSYAGSIAWFQNPSAQVSAHYLIRKSDGQITQMVAENRQAWHAKYHNYYTVGIEHDGRAADAGNWSAAMLNASARLTKSICARRGIDCRTAWNGPGYDTWHLVPDGVRVKGHGMLTQNENRYDPGKYFPWSSYYGLINGGGTPNPPGKYWVDTFANATGYKWPSTLTPVGTLYQGTNYVYCKAWGQEVRVGASYNHYWLKTDLDVGPAGAWVSAYYLSRWGNDEARDNNGAVIPDC